MTIAYRTAAGSASARLSATSQGASLFGDRIRKEKLAEEKKKRQLRMK